MHAAIADRRADLAALCRRHGVSRLEVFGSAARGGDFEPSRSDADFLVTFEPALRDDLAATLLLRAMIDFTLAGARSKRYRHAARHLMDCAGLAASIPDFGAVESHDAYLARLEAKHGRKQAFWALVD